MAKFDLLQRMVLQQLEMHRESILSPNTEQFTIIIKLRPHDGPPRSASLTVLHVYEQPGAALQQLRGGAATTPQA